MFERIKKWYRSLPDKKRYIEFITALLTVPVLITVLLSNYKNLSGTSNPPTQPTPQEEPQVTIVPFEVKPTGGATLTPYPSPTPVPVTECTRQVGPVEITYPDEGQVVTGSPVCIDIAYDQGNYCSVVWAYRINGSPWSQYTDKSICLYDIPPGVKTLEVKVRSIASSDEVVLKRNFTVAGTPSTSPTATPSAATK